MTIPYAVRFLLLWCALAPWCQAEDLTPASTASLTRAFSRIILERDALVLDNLRVPVDSLVAEAQLTSLAVAPEVAEVGPGSGDKTVTFPMDGLRIWLKQGKLAGAGVQLFPPNRPMDKNALPGDFTGSLTVAFVDPATGSTDLMAIARDTTFDGRFAQRKIFHLRPLGPDALARIYIMLPSFDAQRLVVSLVHVTWAPREGIDEMPQPGDSQPGIPLSSLPTRPPPTDLPAGGGAGPMAPTTGR